MAWSALIPFFAWLLVVRAPQVYRFGCWLDRNFGEQAQKRAAAGSRPSPCRREAASRKGFVYARRAHARRARA